MCTYGLLIELIGQVLYSHDTTSNTLSYNVKWISKWITVRGEKDWQKELIHGWWVVKSDFLRMSRIGRQSRKIDFSFILPKHTYGWTYSRKNSFKFQRFILRPKFKKVRNLHIMAVFAALNIQNFALLYENSGGVKTILRKRNLAQIFIHSYTLKSCNTFLEVSFVAF